MSDPRPASPSPSPARAPQTADGPGEPGGHGGLRLLALGAVAFGVLLLAAAAFVLSYAGIHALALSAEVSPRLARIYPLIFDAMLVVTCAAVLSLRGAGLPSRSYAWLSMLVLLGAAAAADALNATGTKLPRRPAAATAAVIPWALVLIGFGLLLCMLRQGRLRRAAAAAGAAAAGAAAAGAAVAAAQRGAVAQPSGQVAVRGMTVSAPALSTSNGEGTARVFLDEPKAAAGLPDSGAAAGLAPDLPHHAGAADLVPDLAIDAEPGQDDPASDEAGASDQPEFAWEPGRARAAGYGGRHRDRPASAFSPAPTLPQASDLEADEATPRSATGLEPGDGADEHHDPEPATVGSGPGPSPEDEPDRDTEPSLEAEAGVEAIAATEPESEVASAAETQADPEGTEAEIWPEAEPAPATPPFDRKRSSPVPPEA